MKQYPHLLYTSQVEGDSTRDNDGNWNMSNPSDVKLSECREVPDGRGREVVSSDGTHHIYTSKIFLPVGCQEIPEGTFIYVKESEDATKKRIEGPVLKFDKGQLHSRIWV